MNWLDAIAIRASLKHCPKAKPLAEMLVAEAARQGATIRELELAGNIAVRAYESAMDQSRKILTEFQREAQSELEGI